MPKQYENDIREKINDAYSLSIGVTDLISIFTFLFFFYHNINVNGNISFYFRARAEKGIARLEQWNKQRGIDNGKLANQIAKLAAIVIKIKFLAQARLVWHAYRLC